MRSISFLYFILLPGISLATHLRGGEITYKPVACGSLTYEITLTLYTNTSSTAQPGNGVLNFGDGFAVPIGGLNNIVIDGKYSIGKAVYITTHTYPLGSFIINYAEPNRNAGILNIQNSSGTRFYIESRLNILTLSQCNHPIIFATTPVDKACKGIAFSHNPAATDPDGDSISYELSVPKRTTTDNVDGFLLPNDPGFYGGINYQQANEKKNGPPVFQINAVTGTLLWDAPGMQGQFETAIKVTEWRKIDDVWTRLGYVVRDMQIIVEDCLNTRPYLNVPVDICVKPGDQLNEIIRGFDRDFDPVIIEWFSSENFQGSPPLIVNQDIQSTKAPFDTANLKFRWNISCNLVREQPYTFVLKITDQPPSGIRLATFYTWKITVVGAPPEYQGATLDLAGKSLKIDWKPYDCTNATVMEIWRRVDSGPSPPDCVRGIPRSLGFERIGSVSGVTSFVDKNLSRGAKYCYRLVALFDSPNRSSSEASTEICIGPIIVDAPVVTNVSVNRTDGMVGEMMVRWTSPYQINKAQFPPPYEYEIYRTTGDGIFTKAFAQKVTDTTFVDHNLNTREKDYGYKIVVYSPQGLTHENPVDTSALAFNPRLILTAGNGFIYLQWDARVPWSNQSQRFPWHYIYRKENGSGFVLIDSVDVNGLMIESGFEYVDVGKFQSRKLSENTVYQYKIRTSGVYGNPKIKEPLRNFSNESESQPIDKSPPCIPVVSIEKTDCENFIKNSPCNFSDFKNVLSWEYPEGCGNDIAYYKILFTGVEGGEFKQIATAVDPGFIHQMENSFSGCYKIIAVDRSGNTSSESEMVCNDNCPNFFVPNVFTPANGDGLNDFFPGITAIEGQLKEPGKCPRFAKSLEMKILNRWGEVVYSVNAQLSEGVKEWSGHDSNGKELPAGVYFYECNVQFDAMTGSLQNQKLKGWVNLVR